MDYLYSLYDALISINVPGDKARAVVDAMERDMGTTLATKADLQILRHDLGQEIQLARKDMELLVTTMTVRLGSVFAVGLGLLFAGLRFG
jgi:hypothetical protein